MPKPSSGLAAKPVGRRQWAGPLRIPLVVLAVVQVVLLHPRSLGFGIEASAILVLVTLAVVVLVPLRLRRRSQFPADMAAGGAGTATAMAAILTPPFTGVPLTRAAVVRLAALPDGGVLGISAPSATRR